MGKLGAGGAAAAKKPAAPVKKAKTQPQPGKPVILRAHNAETPGSIPGAATTQSAAVLAHLAGLKPGPRRFAVEYLRDHNAGQAYIRAGYRATGNAAEVNGARLLRNAQFAAAIAKAEAEMLAQVQEETGISLKRTLEFIARGAYYDPRKFFKPNGELVPITELDDETATALAGFEATEIGGHGEKAELRYISKAKLADRKGYLDMLMKHQGGYAKDNEQGGEAAAKALAGLVVRFVEPRP